jgi:hypothetical protein
VRRIVPVVALLAIAPTIVPGVASSGHPARAQLRLMAAAPVVVGGTGFQAGEHVRLVVRSPALVTRRVTAGRAGDFTMRLKAFAGDICTGFSVTATGDRGSRASYTRLPQQCGALP